MISTIGGLVSCAASACLSFIIRVIPCAGTFVLVIAPLVIVGADGAASVAIDGRPADEAAALISRLTGQEHRLSLAASMTGLNDRPVRLVLIDASPGTTKQALAHALACWWVRASDGAILYQQDAPLPVGPLRSRTHSSGLSGTVANERRLRQLLSPWLGDPHSGLAAVGDGGLWAATLDTDGQARLIELLSLLERGEPRCPALVADPDCLDPERRLVRRIAAPDWSGFATALADGSGLSVSCSPDLSAPPPILAPCRLGDLRARLADAKVEAAIVHGVLCLGPAAGEDREHPALRRRLALLPIRNLIADEVEANLLTTTLRRHVCPAWWPQPAAAMLYLPETRSLLIAADPPTVHAVLDALDLVDLLGLEGGLAALSESRPRRSTP